VLSPAIGDLRPQLAKLAAQLLGRLLLLVGHTVRRRGDACGLDEEPPPTDLSTRCKC
jgi:hypothetical protein